MSIESSALDAASAVSVSGSDAQEETRSSVSKLRGEYIKPGCYVAPKVQSHHDASIFLQKYPMQWCPWSPATYIVDVNGKVYYLMDIINGNFGYELQFQGKQNPDADTTALIGNHVDARALCERERDEPMASAANATATAINAPTVVQSRSHEESHSHGNRAIHGQNTSSLPRVAYKRKMLSTDEVDEAVPRKKSKTELD